MTTTATSATVTDTGRPLAGWVCGLSGLAGVASGRVMALVTPAVAMDMYRYPLSPDA
jgi:hypothetical protein